MRLGARGRDFTIFVFAAKHVTRTRGPRQSDISAKTDDAVGKWQTASNKKPHGHGGGVPAARCQSFKNACPSSGLIEMKRLRVKLRGELFDPLLFDEISP